MNYWFLGYKQANWTKIKYCPCCASSDIQMPNDLVEWQCNNCGAWWQI